MAAADQLKRPAERVIAFARNRLGASAPGAAEGTSRAQLLALAELARRAGGDVPAVGGGDLSPFELRVFSQNGEDGVLAEILRRIGDGGRWFVEFGAGDGVESTCSLLADVLGWRGLFMDAGDAQYEGLSHRYAGHPRVRTAKELVTPERVEGLFAALGVPEDPDVLSIDVDGSDYWVWEAIRAHRPRVVVIEYNSALPPGRRLVQPRTHGAWNETEFYGASLGALESLGEAKGYALVHTDLTGTNAFFVRRDLAAGLPAGDAVPRRRTNFALLGIRHAPDHEGHRYLDLETGRLA